VAGGDDDLAVLARLAAALEALDEEKRGKGLRLLQALEDALE
jgi:hypothetical protein